MKINQLSLLAFLLSNIAAFGHSRSTKKSKTAKKSKGAKDHPFPNDYIYVGHEFNLEGPPSIGLTVPVNLEAAYGAGWSQHEGKYNHPDHPVFSATFGKCGDYRNILTGLSFVGPKSSYYKSGYLEVDESPIDGYDANDLGMISVLYCDYESTPSRFATSFEGVKKVPMTIPAVEEAGYIAGACVGSMGGDHYWNGNLTTPDDWNEKDVPVGIIYNREHAELSTLRIVFSDFLSFFGPKYPNYNSSEFTFPPKSLSPKYGEGFDNQGVGVFGNTGCVYSYCNQPDCDANFLQQTIAEGMTSVHIMFYNPSNVDQWAKCQIENPETCVDLSCECEGESCCGEDGVEKGPFLGFYVPPGMP